MEHEFWLKRWEENWTPFHNSQPHEVLQKHFQKLGLKKGDTVFVPFCGKSQDLIWLRDHQYQVIGVELSPLAVQQFISENQLSEHHEKQSSFVLHSLERIKIFQGSFFDLEPDDLKDVKAVYDRGSLVALPREMRKVYIQQMKRILPRPVPYLLVALEYPQEEMEGPPFSVPEKEVQDYFKDYGLVSCLQRKDYLEDSDHLRERGLSSIFRRQYLILPQKVE